MQKAQPLLAELLLRIISDFIVSDGRLFVNGIKKVRVLYPRTYSGELQWMLKLVSYYIALSWLSQALTIVS